MKGPRCGGLGSKVSRCCGVSRLWNRHSCIPPGACWDAEDQSHHHASESARLRHWCQRHQGPTDWFCLCWFWRGFLSSSQKQWMCVWTHLSALEWSYPFCSAGLEHQKLVWGLQRIPNTLRSVFLRSSFRSIPCIKISQDWTLNAFHGQALATALKLNDTVVDINLAGNHCGNEGAEACEPIWDELTAGGFDLPDTDWHWQTLTVSHFFELEWMDVVSAIVTCEARTFSLCGWHFVFAGNGGGPQHERCHQAFELGVLWNPWCWGGGQVVVFCCSEGLPLWRIQGLDLRSPGRGMLQITFEFDYDVAGEVFCDK